MQDLQRKQREDQAEVQGRIVKAHTGIGEVEITMQRQLNELEAQRKANVGAG